MSTGIPLESGAFTLETLSEEEVETLSSIDLTKEEIDAIFSLLRELAIRNFHAGFQLGFSKLQGDSHGRTH